MQQLLLPSGYFLKAVTFSDLSVLLCSFFQNTVGELLEQCFCRAATFSEHELVQNKDRRTTFLKRVLLSIQYQIFQNSYFFNKANSSKEVPSKESYFSSEKLPF